MTPIKYKSNNLYVEGLSVEKLADDNQTPFYCYSEKYIEDQYQALKSAFDMKAK
ncbi:MAG: diaminopimelate decarboxylase, partial [Rhodobiaceae bacterium]|nr:diaminopimelate decarboxylase [Rhodobiaceae bacterium]